MNWLRDVSRFLSMLSGIGLAVGTICCCIAQEPNRRTPEEVISYLSSLRHGLSERVMDEETKALLEEVVRNPAIYADAIKNAMTLRPNALLDDEDYRLIGTALGLARRMDASLFAESLQALIVDTTEHVQKLRIRVKPRIAVDDEELRRKYDRVLSLRSSALDILGNFQNPNAVDTCMQNLSREIEYTSGADVVIFRYLERVGRLRPDILPKLQEMYDSPNSALQNNPRLARVIESIDTAARDCNEGK